MPSIVRIIALLGLLLLVPILPFLACGAAIETRVEHWLAETHSASMLATVVAGLLAADIVLPVPSSLLSTFAGAELGIVGATLVCWLGMSIGCGLAFGLARVGGPPLVERWVGAQDQQRLERWSQRYGRGLLLMTRPLPVLAEATVLLLGATDGRWRHFIGPMLLSNLGIALCYAVLGSLSRDQHLLVPALLASVFVPITALALVRWLWGRLQRSSQQSLS